MSHRRIIVVGGSAGSIPALGRLVAGLPANTAAAILLVVHQPSQAESRLPDVLRRAGSLEARHADDGETLREGVIYVARPDFHLLLAPENRIRLVKGPKENRTRPAIDPLFRSAAAHYGDRVIGTLLSGVRDDGVSGLWTIKDQGGLAVVQDPQDAEWPDMPRNAIENLPRIDYVAPASKLGPLLGRLSAEPVAAKPTAPVSAELSEEVAMTALETGPAREHPGRPSVYACPDCHGTLFEIRQGSLVRYRCRTGHAYSLAALEEEQLVQVDGSLWNAMRAMEEYASLVEQLAERSQAEGDQPVASDRLSRAEQAREQATVLRQMIETGFGEAPSDRPQGPALAE